MTKFNRLFLNIVFYVIIGLSIRAAMAYPSQWYWALSFCIAGDLVCAYLLKKMK